MKTTHIFVHIACGLLLMFPSIGISQTWNYLGMPGFSDSLVGGTQTAVDKFGNVYVAFVEYYDSLDTYSPGVSVKKYDGNNWVYIGSPRFNMTDTWHDAMDLAIDKNGTLYLALAYDQNSYKASVMKFNGSAWEYVGYYGFTPSTVEEISLVLDSNSTPYIAFKDGNANEKVSVMKFDGNGWIYVGQPGIANINQTSSTSLVFSPDNKPYIAFTDYITANSQLKVAGFDGANWDTLPGCSSVNYVFTPKIAFDRTNGDLYVVYNDFSTDKLCVKKHDGASWINVGLSNFSDAGALDPTIVVDSQGKPIVAARSLDGPFVMRFNGSAWNYIGNEGFTTGDAYSPELVADENDNLFFGYTDLYHNQKISVMAYSFLTGISEYETENKLNLSPNPADEFIAISTMPGERVNFVYAVNILGKAVLLNYDNGTVFSNSLPEGLYTLMIVTESKKRRYSKVLVIHQ